MGLILCIETATEVCSVALAREGQCIGHHTTTEPYTHVSQINCLIEECLANSRVDFKTLDAVAVSAGPGSYTGLRVGVSVAKGICFGMNIPLISINTLLALASGGKSYAERGEIYLCSLIDARRMEVYTATYDRNFELIEPSRALIVRSDTFDHLRNQGKEIIFVGNGTQKVREIVPIEGVIFTKIICSAQHLVQIAEKKYCQKQYSDLAQFAPIYLKPPHITKAKKFI
ncbi:MAG: tRNA (adenosine(37)-N6)-threonylcarbamoyltransferase complex dimerization subunit type 1 TsaB [Saprospiraceae bacterium]|nr:tRNA (adenosine(37)-N6)-threonylcarbamoyltransferase complex dimerization subunit type 1 TsaB [Saprospiraceae bacterium]